MSKSLGNTETVPAITAHTRAVALRFYLISAHYRSPIEYSQEALADSVTSFNRIEGFLLRVRDRAGAGGTVEIGEIPADFALAMDDDLHVPRALAVVHEHVRHGNTALEAGDHPAAKEAAGRVRAMLGVLGTDPLDEQWVTHRDDSGLLAATGSLVSSLLEQREQARAAKDFATSDRIRDQLAAAGFVVQDSRDGATWALAPR
jgi:cysteinyl-tRNA synthetase